VKPLLRAVGLSFRYPGSPRKILDSVDLSIAPGERVLLAGPSGAGKSTLLSIAAGFVPHYVAGTVEGELVLGTDRVSMVFQSPEAQMVAPTVREEIAFGPENLGRPAAEIRRLIDLLADKLGIADLLARSPSSLSGGEQQKVALAAALAMEPELLLLDEPTSYLDPDSTRTFFELLEGLDPRTAVLIVEHKLDQALAKVGRLLFLDESGLIADRGSPDRLDLSEFLPWRLAHLVSPNEESAAAASHSPSPVLLSTAELSHSYDGRKCVLEGVNLAVSPGEVVVVMGQSGAGKSTLLGRLAGLLPGRPGRVLLADVDVARARPSVRYARLLALPQNPEHFFLRETVADELVLATNCGAERPRRGAAAGAPSELATEAARAFRLGSLLGQSPFSLSEGEKRRLNLACAFLDDRPLLLLDEPTYGLDYDAFEQLVASLRLLASRGAAIVVVTHSPELAWLVADRIVLLEHGRTVRSFSPANPTETLSTLPERYLPVWRRERSRTPSEHIDRGGEDKRHG